MTNIEWAEEVWNPTLGCSLIAPGCKRVMASNGYVLVRVGKDHHLADIRGYAYEHRLVAEQAIGRRLQPGEQVHHIDGNKTNNHGDNLQVCVSLAEHRKLERRVGLRRRDPGEENCSVECACGCGYKLLTFDQYGRIRRFISGHNHRLRNSSGRFS